MKLAASLFLTCLVVIPRVAAQDANGAMPKSALFWKVSTGTNVTYLLGSIHLGTKDMYPLPKEIEDAFASSAALAVEGDLLHMDKAKLQALMVELGIYPGDDLLWNHISEKTRQNVERFCSTYGLSADKIAKMKPWMLAISADTFPMMTMKNGISYELGIDNYFLEKAGKAHDTKRILEIESADSLLKLLSVLDADLQEVFLDAAMEDLVGLPEKMKIALEVWRSGDADGLDKILNGPSRAPEQVKKALIQDRIPHMADVAEQFLNSTEQAFVVVGVGHMVGKEGIVEILRKRGYSVEQVTLKQ